MVEVGEATGALQDMLNAISDFFDEEIETTLARFTRLIEPVMLIIMAVIIAAILLALYLPVFQLSSAVG
jgi:type IV pilus assembly protein PilC